MIVSTSSICVAVAVPAGRNSPKAALTAARSSTVSKRAHLLEDDKVHGYRRTDAGVEHSDRDRNRGLIRKMIDRRLRMGSGRPIDYADKCPARLG